jgi:hypothetical protein
MTTDACSVAAGASWHCAAPLALNKVEDAEAFHHALVTRPAAPVFEASNDTTSADSKTNSSRADGLSQRALVDLAAFFTSPWQRLEH